jgi:hypothetical protein
MTTNPTVVKRALLEVGKQIAELTDEDVKRVYNCVLRRLPNKRTGNIVQGASPMEKYGYGFATDPDRYAMEKEVCGYEGLE